MTTLRAKRIKANGGLQVDGVWSVNHRQPWSNPLRQQHQGTAASWFAVRQQAGKAGNLIADTATNHRELVVKVEQYKDADYIVLDGPP